MARNRKSETGVGLGSVLTAAVLCTLFVSLGVGFVWSKNQISLLGEQIKKDEISLSDLQRYNRIRRDQLAGLCSPVALDDKLKKLNLGLGPPALVQVIHLTEKAAPGNPGPSAEGALAQRYY